MNPKAKLFSTLRAFVGLLVGDETAAGLLIEEHIKKGYAIDAVSYTHLIHEVLHGIIRHYGIECESEEKEEYLVEKLAYGLFQVLVDNEERLFGTETQSG